MITPEMLVEIEAYAYISNQTTERNTGPFQLSHCRRLY